MLGWCTVCYGGVLYDMVVYCVLWWCTVCYGGVLCGRAVYCMLGRCTVCYGGVLCGRGVYYIMVVYCMGGVLYMLWRCTVCYVVYCVLYVVWRCTGVRAVYCVLLCAPCYGGVLCGMAVYCGYGQCTVRCTHSIPPYHIVHRPNIQWCICVCFDGVCVMVVYYVLWQFTLC